MLPAGAGVRLFCTATLIGERTLLTAAHCVDDFGIGQTDLLAHNAADVRAGNDGAIAVIERRIHPDWNAHASGPLYQGRDLALLLLGKAPAAAPVPLSLHQLTAADIGLPLRVVGYGDDASGTDGVRQSVQLSLSHVPGSHLQYEQRDGKGSCAGDSGGPTFAVIGGVETLVGVTSFGDEACVGSAYAARIDTQAAFIHAWFAEKESARCARDTLCALGCADLDCSCLINGVCDAGCADPKDDPDCVIACPDCVADGASCNRDAQCPQGVCMAEGYCAPVCALADASCTSGESCDEASGLCLHATRSEIPVTPAAPMPKKGCAALEPGLMPLLLLWRLRSALAELRRPR